MDVIRLVRGDEKPVIKLTLTDDVSGLPVDLTLSTTSVYVKFRAVGSTTLLATINCTKIGTGDTGQVYFDFSGHVLDVDPGLYEGEIIVDFNGIVQTLYDTMRFRVRDNF